jgi:hypothetical protein
MKKRNLKFTPPKGMFSDENFIHRFERQDAAPNLSEGKRWIRVEVVRKALDKHGDLIEKDKQVTEVFARPDEATGLGLTRCPTRLKTKDAYEFKTSVYTQNMGPEDRFSGAPIITAQHLAEADKEVFMDGLH